AITNLRPQAFATHQPGHPVLAAALAQITQVAGNLAVAVHAPALHPGLLDQAQYAPIVLGPCRQRRPTPGVVAAGVHAQHPAHAAHPELPFVVAHEGVLHPDCLAKYAAAFFRMSRSSVTRRSSDLSRRNSSAWSAVAARSGPDRPYCFRHVWRLWIDTPSRSATSATEWPRSVTCLTASTLNSSVYRLLLMDTPAAAVDYGCKVSTKHGAIHRSTCRSEVHSRRARSSPSVSAGSSRPSGSPRARCAAARWGDRARSRPRHWPGCRSGSCRSARCRCGAGSGSPPSVPSRLGSVCRRPVPPHRSPETPPRHAESRPSRSPAGRRRVSDDAGCRTTGRTVTPPSGENGRHEPRRSGDTGAAPRRSG